jgi:TRAP-type mannitol/chloroaromatic compound transport system permease large subunit
MMFIYIILGCFIDPAGMCLVTVPVFLPVVTSLGFDPLWFGVLFIVNTEMAFLTPPFGFNLFYLKAIVPKEVTMNDIYLSIWPFVGCQFICLVLVVHFPELALWLPNLMITAVAK